MRIDKRLLWVSMVLCGTCLAAPTVSWIPGQTPPQEWTITPVNPTTSSAISFSGPTDVFSNSCLADRGVEGHPVIAVDTTNRVVTLSFQGPLTMLCTTLFQPVSGLQGQFGPLAAGRWTFRCASPKVNFVIPFTVGATNVIYVDAHSPSGSPNGTTWSKAFQQLQDGFNAAWSGDEIRVADGTYTPDQGGSMSSGDRTASFDLPQGVKLKGGYAGYGAVNPNLRDPNQYASILSGDLQGDDLAGMLNREDNSYHVVTSQGIFPFPRLDGFTIQSGQADGAPPNDLGGGLYIMAGTPEVVNCTFKSNGAVFGGAIASIQASPMLGNCRLTGNQATLFGGALYNEEGTVSLTNGLIVGNSAGQASALGSSVLYNLGGSVILNECTVADNVAPNGEAVTSLVWGSPTMGQITVTNCILFNGGSEIFSTDPCAVTVAYSDVQGGWSGIGNLKVAPHFVNPGQRSLQGDWIDGDYHLMPDSPCIDAGDKTQLPADVMDLDGDGNMSEILPVDLDGNPRVLGMQVDMGAYEQLGSGPGPGPGWQVVTVLDVTYDVPAGPPTFPINVSGSSQNTVNLNFKAELKLDAAPASAAGGTWTATFNPDPNPVGPGTVGINYDVHGVGLQLWKLPANTLGVKVATVTISARPAP
jgi:hypothetical protein